MLLLITGDYPTLSNAFKAGYRDVSISQDKIVLTIGDFTVDLGPHISKKAEPNKAGKLPLQLLVDKLSLHRYTTSELSQVVVNVKCDGIESRPVELNQSAHCIFDDNTKSIISVAFNKSFLEENIVALTQGFVVNNHQSKREFEKEGIKILTTEQALALGGKPHPKIKTLADIGLPEEMGHFGKKDRSGVEYYTLAVAGGGATLNIIQVHSKSSTVAKVIRVFEFLGYAPMYALARSVGLAQRAWMIGYGNLDPRELATLSKEAVYTTDKSNEVTSSWKQVCVALLQFLQNKTSYMCWSLREEEQLYWVML